MLLNFSVFMVQRVPIPYYYFFLNKGLVKLSYFGVFVLFVFFFLHLFRLSFCCGVIFEEVFIIH